MESWNIKRTNGFVSAKAIEQNGHTDFKPLVPEKKRFYYNISEATFIDTLLTVWYFYF